jgi:hypothetical protein
MFKTSIKASSTSEPRRCTSINAAMIASAAYFLLRVDPSLAQVQFVDMESRKKL